MFENISWPIACVYNIGPEGAVGLGGSAIVDVQCMVTKVLYYKRLLETQKSAKLMWEEYALALSNPEVTTDTDL